MESRYRVATRPVADPAAVVRGDRFRITVLTDGLLRLEYAADGHFEDRASAFALFRDLPVPKYRVVERPHQLEIITERVHLVYDRAQFSTSGLSIQVRGNVSTYHSVWRFGEIPDDLGGTARTLDKVDGVIPLEPGVVSRWGFALLDDSRSLVLNDAGWVAPRDGSRTDLYFFGYGRDYREALAAFYAVSGPPPVLPRFALGNWWSRYHRYTADEYTDLMTRFQSEGIPFSVAVVDIDWHPVDIDPSWGSGWTGYSWNRELFSHPQGFLEWLHEHHLRVTLNVHPADGIRAFEDSYPDMMKALGRNSSNGDAIAFDITDPEFLVAYFDVLHRALERDGVDFWWIDWQSGPHSRVAGIDPLWMLNHFHFLDNARDGKRPLTFSRYAGPGSHRYPVGFSGDTVVTWASLDFQPYFTATAANIGYGWWSHDIGGHMLGAKDDELATRWVQLGVFSPIMRLHSGSNPFNSKEPWRFGERAARVMTHFLRLRHRLVPYLHTMNHRAAKDGIPLVQPMYWSHPDVAESYEVPNQFRFGSQLIVAPITSPSDPTVQMGSVRVWLPEGIWVDIFTGLVYRGDRLMVMHRDLTSLPVLAGSGAIIPLVADHRPGNGSDNPTAVEVLVVVGEDATFELVEDDGTGTGLDPANLVRTPIVLDQQVGSVTVGPAAGAVTCLPALRSWQLAFLAVQPNGQMVVSVDGEPTEFEHRREGGREIISVVDVPVGSTLRVEIGPDPALAANDVGSRLFSLLDRAQVDFEAKRRIYTIAASAQPLSVRMSHLQALTVDRGLETAISEILLAGGER